MNSLEVLPAKNALVLMCRVPSRLNFWACVSLIPYTVCMGLPTAYLTSFKNTSDILQSIQAAQAPERFTVKFLEGLGYSSSNDRAMINVLKALGFLDDTGVPKQRYHEYLDQSQSGIILADGIREAYADLFRINKKAYTMTSTEVKNKMKTLSEGSFTDRVLTQMAGTFTTLVKSADFSSSRMTPASNRVVDDEPRNSALDDQNAVPHHNDISGSAAPLDIGRMGIGLTYQINIQLPESRDQAVYDALFKALREHLR